MKSISLRYFVFSFLILLISILFFWRLSLFFIYPSLSYLWQIGIIYLIFLTFVPLFFFLIDNRYIVYPTLCLSAFSFFVFFPFSGVYFSTGLLVLLLFGLGYEYSRHEKEQRIKLSLGKSCFKGLSFVILAISLLLAMIYYFNPLLTINQEALEVSPQFFEPLVVLSDGIIQSSLPNGLAQDGLIDSFKQEIEVKLAQSVNQALKGFIGPYAREISIGLAIALFLALRFVGMILRIISIILSRIIFYILFICKIVKVDSEMRSKEIVNF